MHFRFGGQSSSAIEPVNQDPAPTTNSQTAKLNNPDVGGGDQERGGFEPEPRSGPEVKEADVVEDRSNWTEDQWNLSKIERYEKNFEENSSRGNSQFLLCTSVAVILDAQGRSRTGGVTQFPTNNGSTFGFSYNNWTLEFAPGEFPEFEEALPIWEQTQKKLKPDEPLLSISPVLKQQILNRAAEAKRILQNKIR